MRLIDADLLIKIIKNSNSLGGLMAPVVKAIYNYVIKLVESMPTAENTAEWDKRSVMTCGNLLRTHSDVVEYRCSKCRRWSAHYLGQIKGDYCSHCGAKMINTDNTMDDYMR